MTSITATRDEKAIGDVLDRYGDLLRTGDVDALVDLYGEDAALLQPDLPAARGKQEIAAAYRAGFDAMEMDFRLQPEQVIVGTELAAARCSSSGTVTMRTSGERTAMHFRELFVLRRRDDGWRIEQYMFQPNPVDKS